MSDIGDSGGSFCLFFYVLPALSAKRNHSFFEVGCQDAASTKSKTQRRYQLNQINICLYLQIYTVASKSKPYNVYTEICKSQKDVDFLKFFDATKSNLYPTVRHRYNQLTNIAANGISHLKLFTKHLKNIIDAQQLSSDSCLNIVEQYRQEEPTLNSAGFVTTISDQASVVKLPRYHIQTLCDFAVKYIHYYYYYYIYTVNKKLISLNYIVKLISMHFQIYLGLNEIWLNY